VWSDAGYLPQAGPVPLRFRVLPPPVNDQVNAPVAPAPAPPAPISLPSPPMPSALKQTTLVPPIQAVTNGPALEFNAGETATGSVPVPVNAPEAVISPQMLIKFFTAPTNAVTNATAAGVEAPVGFTPPLVATPPPKPPASSPAPHSSPP
jgi:hypothetical protein